MSITPPTIGASERARFDRDGFLVVDGIISDRLIERLRSAFDDLFSGRFETGVRPDEVNWQQETGDPSLTRQICNGWKANRAVAEVVLDEGLGRALADLTGWPGVRIMIDNVLWKPPGGRSLGFHQDSAYLQWFTPSDLTTLWIALDDCHPDGGTIEFARGSHRWDRHDVNGDFHGPADYQLPMRQAAEAEGVEADIVPVTVEAGAGSFHHGWTWHGSGPNTTDRPRRSLVLHAMGQDVRYVADQLHQGIGPIYGRYRQLMTELLDENHFPVLWSRDGYRTPGLPPPEAPTPRPEP